MDQAEQLRNIIKQQNNKKHLARVLTVTSGKGGVGKSNISVNLALQLSRCHKRVVVLDADFGLANIEIMLGIRPKYNLADAMFRGEDLKDVIMEGPENIGFISGGSGLKELTNLDSDQVRSLVGTMYELDHLADVIIVDTGAGISETVINLVMSSGEVLLVVTPEPTSITDAYALLKTLCRREEFEPSQAKIHMISNRTQGYEDGKELFDKLNTVVEKFLSMSMNYIGHIPYDDKMFQAIMKQQPVSVLYPNAKSSRALLDIAMLLENGQTAMPPEHPKGLSGLFTKIFRSRKE